MVNLDGSISTDHFTSDCSSRSMVFDCGTDGNLCGSDYPDCDHGGRAGSWETGDCSMVASELEEDVLVDEVLSDLSSVCVDGNHVSGYLRFSLQGTS